MYASKTIDNTSGLATGNINTDNAQVNNLTVTGSTTFPIGSISQNAINGLVTELADLQEYALITGTSFTGNISAPTITLNGVDLTTQLDSKQPAIDETVDVDGKNISGDKVEIRTSLYVYGVTIPNTTLCNIQYLDINSSLKNQLAAKQQKIDASVDVYGKNVSGDSINVRSYLVTNGVNISAIVLSKLQCMDILNASSLGTTSLSIHAQIEQNAFAFTGGNTFLQAPLYLGTDTNPPSNTFITRSYVDTQVATKQNTITNTTNLVANTITTSGNIVVQSNATSSAQNTNYLSAPKIMLNGTDINSTFMQLNNAVASNGLTINSINQSGALFSSGLTLNYGSSTNLIKYNLVPQYLPTFYSAGSTYYTNSGVPSMFNQACYVNWAVPSSVYASSTDAAMNWAVVEITYTIQESPINNSRTVFTINNPINGIGQYTTTSTTSAQTNVNTTINAPAISCTCQYYIACSISANSFGGANNTNTGYNSYVKYLSGSSQITSSQTMYQSTFTPIQFYYQSFNKMKIQFNFPANNNGTNSAPYGGSNYISSYGCSVRVVSSNGDNSSSAANLYPNNGTSQPVASLSFAGRAYLSVS